SQEQLYRKEKLATIGKIAGSIGHEIRNPLGVISNSTYFLNIKLKDSDGKVKKHLNILQREILRVNEIISDLLDFTRIKQPFFKEVDINIFIKDILENFKFPENIILKKHLDAELPRIQIDSNQIQQAFQNIILNAIQAMPEGGKLEIKTLTSENTVEIVFKDTGVGIPRENLQKIFEPLFTTKARGIGLGLSIVKDIVESHKGMIYVESEVDVDTSFTVKLPILRKEEM
ncbi:MAG: GHKL domain-containing protein, partial [Candidatus Heimdallarchaeota archaeon]|nr:GHKL domain-containing protein [Candidatus Heimdallarchaeota archaeon]